MKRIIAVCICILLVCVSCGSNSEEIKGSSTAKTSTESSTTKESSTKSTTKASTTKESVVVEDVVYEMPEKPEVEVVHATDVEDSTQETSETFAIKTKEANGYQMDGQVVTITKGGTYTLSGKLEGYVIVDAKEEKVTLELNQVSISSGTTAPILFKNAKNAKVELVKGTYNVLRDLREEYVEEDDETDADEKLTPENANAALRSTCDLTISGEGSLVIEGKYRNGIQSKNDLTLEGVNLKVTAANHAVKGKDSITIEEGNYLLISQAGDGLKTSNSDISEKDNQRGTVSITDATVTIYAGHDGIDSSYDIVIDGSTNLSVNTDTYSEYTGAETETGTDFYVIVPKANYAESTDYYCYYYNESGDNDGVFQKATFFSMVSGGNTSYYGLQLTAPSGYSSVRFLTMKGGETPSLEGASAISAGGTINTAMNGVLLSFSGENIEDNWVSLTVSSGAQATTESCKGLKSDNEIIINNGNVSIRSTDDAIHANDDTDLENGEDALGNVTINGGNVEITSSDDGIHADQDLTINGGRVNVITSYEGFEASIITINGGTSFVYATDDALNAADGSSSGGMGPMGGGGMSANSNCSVNINGGYLVVRTPSGDTDAIDSNGGYVQTGGYVLVQGGSSSGSVAGSVDVNGTIQITGGITIAVGGICEVPEDSVNCYASNGTSMNSGDYVLQDGSGNTIATFSLEGNYSSVWICSDELQQGTTYTLTQDGTKVLSWTQEKGTQGYSGGGMGGGKGGFGRW